MKLRHPELASHQQGLMQQLRDFWKEGHLCDVVLKSADGIQHQAHRNVLSAASAAFKALLCAPFREVEQIRQGKPVEMAASGGVVSAFLDYLYGGEPEVTTMDAVEVLRLAGAYGLHLLAASVESDLRALSLTSQLALQLLPETVVLGLHELQQACEEQIACDFQQCALQDDFQKLSAKQLQRILQREDLNVSREELVAEALFRWSKPSRDKKRDMVLLLAHVDFPSLSTSNLDLLRHAAQSLGPWGLHLECDIKEAMAVHKKRSASGVACTHRPKRRCLAHWSGGLGADKESNLDGSRVTPHVNGFGGRLVWHQGTLILVDHVMDEHDETLMTSEVKIVACKPGDRRFWTVAGQGAPVNGVNELALACTRTGHAVSPAGELFLISFDNDLTAQLLSFQDRVGKVFLRGLEEPLRLCGSPNGVLYLIDKWGERVQKLEGSEWTPLLSTGQLPENQQEKFESIFASGQETLYFMQGARVLRLLAGASVPTVVADCGELKRKNAGFFVTEDEKIFICGRDKKVWMAQAGESSWSVVSHLPNVDALYDVLVQGQVLYVLACQNQFDIGFGISAVYQCALPPRLELEALSSSWWIKRLLSTTAPGESSVWLSLIDSWVFYLPAVVRRLLQNMQIWGSRI